MSGYLIAAEELGYEIFPSLLAVTQPSGIIAHEAYDEMMSVLIADLKESECDAVALVLHGAGVVRARFASPRHRFPVRGAQFVARCCVQVDSVEDMEGDMARQVREVIGPDKPIVASFDLHGNVSDNMADLFDLMLPCHLYPHTDLAERGLEAVRLLPALLDGSLQAVTHVEHIPMLCPGATTDQGFPAAAMNEVCFALEEKHPGVIECGVFHGFPYTDVYESGMHVVCTTNGNPELAAEVAAEVGRWIWDNRDWFKKQASCADPKDAVAEALAQPVDEVTQVFDNGVDTGEARAGPVVVNETADNPGGGSPGDSTHLLRAMTEACGSALADQDARIGARTEGGEPPPAEACFSSIYDPAVVEQAAAAGVGSWITVSLGGKLDTSGLHGAPIEAAACVLGITDGKFRLEEEWGGGHATMGRTARLWLSGVDVLVASERQQTLSQNAFISNGIDPTKFKLVGVKSSNHFRAGFRSIASLIITADAPGLTTANPAVFEHVRNPAPLWPQAEDASYTPMVELATELARL